MVLKPALLEHSEHPPSAWPQLAQGQWLQQQVKVALQPVWRQVFGYHLATYGGLAGALDYSDCHIKHRFNVGRHDQAQVIANGTAWPFAAHSLDAIVSVGMLEFERDPHRLLRELSYSLIADGHLILVGMNPLSPAVLRGLWPSQQKPYPWSGRYFTRARVLDWLALLNYEVTVQTYFAPTWMLPNREPPGWGITGLAKYFPVMGAAYLIVARKREHAMLLKPKRQQHAQVQGLKLANYSRSDVAK